MNRYLDGMKEIQAGDELKRQLMNSAKPQPSPGSGKAFAFKKTAALLAAACAIIFLAVFGASFLQSGSEKAVFPSFVITAYAADGTPVEMKPNVQLPLGKYSPFMSSVPGLPISISAEGADAITVTVTEGSLSLWSPSAPKVIPKGKSMSAASGTKIYWSPMNDQSPETTAKKSTVSVIAYKNNKEIGRRSIEIRAVDDFFYSGTVVEK
ncbi:hypothetical protein [Paenibacillus sp. Soil522]|uniref:hypothetical protein n=1 Tax=Paenibacillus sp. Soil522 TaxID=1736388 RepID=UPI0006F84D7C|nr:hypothetical protein [Paenibacillus sp. Soil522]KRE46415.1 hypothetical protein ASG81_11460 [Paenibacillus sp. Soil522]